MPKLIMPRVFEEAAKNGKRFAYGNWTTDWIKVEKAKPERHVEVLVVVKEPGEGAWVTTGIFHGGNGWTTGICQLPSTVLCWKPMPKPPV